MKHKATMADNKSEKKSHKKIFLSVCEHDWHLNNMSLSEQQSIPLFFVLLLLLVILLVVLQDSRHNLDRLYNVYSQKKVRLQWTNTAEHKGFRFWSHLNQRCYVYRWFQM